MFVKLIVPSPPRNVTVQRINNLMARVQWNEPLQLNGRINGYHIYVHNMAANLTEVKRLQTSDFTQHLFEYTIHNLSNDTMMIIIIATKTNLIKFLYSV